MGLDNGIDFKLHKNASEKVKNLLTFEWDELCYWRKCWNIREKILSYLDNKYETGFDYSYPLDIEDIREIVVILESFNEENWVCGNAFVNGSIWEWDEIKDNLAGHIRNLYYILGIMDWCVATDTEIPFDLQFYDSY